MENKMSDKLIAAIAECENLKDDQKQKIGNKFYALVHTRVQIFRKHLGSEGRIQTIILEQDDNKVSVQAVISIWKNDSWVEIANDFAEEYRGVGPVNKTSALENCVTSSIGRALSACGLTGGEYASAFEVDNAINNKPEAKTKPKPAKTKEAPKSKSDEKYTVFSDRAKSEVVCKLNANPFANYCFQYMANEADPHHSNLYAGTQQEIERCLRDDSLKQDSIQKLTILLAKFGDKNGN
tara:strand:+ start:105 stop:818 length:714 start_codon:yes stop_codon:yes gene_type:complete